MQDLFRPWGSITVSGQGTGLPKTSSGKLLPKVVPKRFAHCGWTSTSAIEVVGYMAPASVCRDVRHDCARLSCICRLTYGSGGIGRRSRSAWPGSPHTPHTAFGEWHRFARYPNFLAA